MHHGSIEMLGEELVAVCYIKPERAEATAEKYGCKAYTDYIEMLDNEKLDAIHLCLPHYIHCKVAAEAISRGVAVLSEKPMDFSYEAAECLKGLEASIKKTGNKIVVARCFSFTSRTNTFEISYYMCSN
jgi:predicted dehydrogenase